VSVSVVRHDVVPPSVSACLVHVSAGPVMFAVRSGRPLRAWVAAAADTQ
jgi:hypothetical protein